ncbi:hypothetical protein F5Y02DRAFT_405706 [Annulohypoxylon stygium]|nr:hypothetical protein F5Y02DRAFT_405706 [Annulohypoxylon stygium]
MSGRGIAKSSSRSRGNQRVERGLSADYSERFGASVLLCSNCVSCREDDCFLLSGYSRYNHCIRHQRRKCDVLEMNSLERVSVARERIEKERREAEDELVRLQQELQSKISEKINKLQRLRRQEDLLKERGLQMVRNGDDFIDEVPSEGPEQSRSGLVLPGSDVDISRVSHASFSGVNFDLGPMSPSTEAFLASVGQGSGDENRQASTSRSGGVQ